MTRKHVIPPRAGPDYKTYRLFFEIDVRKLELFDFVTKKRINLACACQV